ncbi:hypothetical protein SAMN04488063_3623 [Halopelagius inordinatus]|uniref:Peptidase family M23 n=1 Tax=Halopelagius inordinatus TaxID=553467 RepID=A0A1I2WQC3_9EURY|nr:hypothetical protein [Halopelagius inordinatus]SFH02887.1 hypothetical protein SAMN04488063_3623 [Halopelagius inordinatus]
MDGDDCARISADVLDRYRRFSLYNSPYPAHDDACAIDLYPASNDGLSPVSGDVVETRTVRAPPKPYAHEEEYLVLIDTGDYVARILHVRPEVEVGDSVEVGDRLGPMIRSGFFAPWVGNHVHLGFRRRDQNPHRAGGSLPVVADVSVEPVPWDGTGTVVETGETYAVLDEPTHPAPGDRWAAVAGDCGLSPVALDGGLAHYSRGGVLSPGADGRTVSFLGHPVGTVAGRSVAWDSFDVVANGDRITGISLFAGSTPEFGAKLVCPDRSFAAGESVEVEIRETDDPVRLD